MFLAHSRYLYNSWHIVGTKKIQFFLLTSYLPLHPSVTSQNNLSWLLWLQSSPSSFILLETNSRALPPTPSLGLALLWPLADSADVPGKWGRWPPAKDPFVTWVVQGGSSQRSRLHSRSERSPQRMAVQLALKLYLLDE